MLFTVLQRSTGALALLTALAVVGGLGSATPFAHASEAQQRYLVVVSNSDVAGAEATARRAGASVTESFRNIGMLSVRASQNAATALDRAPGLTVHEDVEVSLARTQNPAPSWGLDRVDQRDLPLSGSSAGSVAHTGQGVWAYIADTGILSAHQEFGGRVAPGMTRIVDGRGTEDCHGHGTHVAGTVAGKTLGVAHAATLIPLRVMDCAGAGVTSDVIAGMDWAIGHHPAGQPAVMNLSVGSSSSVLTDAVDRVTADGIIVVAAAGNSGVDACTTYPAASANAIAVGATNSSDARSSWSNFGPCLDLFAPGESVRSAGHTGTTSVVAMSGTSMAAPHVAGAVALLLNANPSLTTSAVRTALISGATSGKVTSPGTGSPNLLLFVDPQAGVTVTAAPSAPTAPQLSLATTTSGAVNWAQPTTSGTEPITGYAVTLRNASTGAAVASRTVSSGTFTTTFTGLVSGTSYVAAIRAITSTSTSAEALTGTVTTPTAPASVQNLTLAVSGAGALTSAWAAPSSDGGSAVLDYSVTLRNASTGAVVSSRIVSSTTRSVTQTGLTVGTAYRVTVAARNAVGASSALSSASVTAATTSSAVRSVTVSYPATLTTRLSWSAPSSTGGSPILRYEHRVTTTADTSSWTTWTSTGTTRSATITGIARGATRYVQIRAVTAAGAGTIVQVTVKPTI
jgi:subtilisin family serine protease